MTKTQVPRPFPLVSVKEVAGLVSVSFQVVSLLALAALEVVSFGEGTWGDPDDEGEVSTDAAWTVEESIPLGSNKEIRPEQEDKVEIEV